MRSLLAAFIILCSTSAIGQVQVTLDVYPPTCEGCCDGAADISIIGCMTPDYTIEWSGPAIIFSNWNLSDVCESGVYNLILTDSNGNIVEINFEMTIDDSPYTLVENFAIDCVSGGGVPFDCLLFSFPPSDSLANGEACVVPPECWDDPVSYLWFDESLNAIGTSDCITNLPPGNYFVEVVNSDGEQVTFDVPMVAGSDIGMMSQEVCPPNGLSESESQAFITYPNPASDVLQIMINESNRGMTYIVHDLQGRMILQGDIDFPITNIGVEELESGNYILSIIDVNKRSTLYFTKL